MLFGAPRSDQRLVRISALFSALNIFLKPPRGCVKASIFRFFAVIVPSFGAFRPRQGWVRFSVV